MVKLLPPWFDVADNNVIIIDFFDSFTFNIASQLNELGISSKVISYDRLHIIDRYLKESDNAIIYGPGPGHPDDYPLAKNLFERLSRNTSNFHLGICLGHQLIWKTKGVETIQSSAPQHGSSVEIILPSWEQFPRTDWGKSILVQRYNSLTLDLAGSNKKQFYVEHEECQIGRFYNGITYQFHPESVGTSYPEIFFKPLLNFLYNCTNG